MHTPRPLLPLLALAALGLAAVPAHAQTAYIDDFVGSTGLDQFATIDLQTGLITVINPNLDAGLFALGFGADGNLYGLSPSGSDTLLFQVDPATGTETQLADFSNLPDSVNGGGVDANGIFQAVTLATSSTKNHSTLFSVDPVAHTDTVESLTFANADGLVAPDNTGNVYVSDTNVTSSGADGLDKVAIGSGGTRFQGDTGLNNLFTGFFSGGKLFTFGDDPNNNFTTGVYTLDPATGAPTLVALTSDNNDIFASALAPAAAPEPSQLAAFAVGLLGLGALAVKARKRQSA